MKKKKKMRFGGTSVLYNSPGKDLEVGVDSSRQAALGKVGGDKSGESAGGC